MEAPEGGAARDGSLPPWSEELADELREIYHSAPPVSLDDEPSRHGGLEAVYRHIRGLLRRGGE